MRTIVAVVATSLVTCVAMRLMDARAGDAAVESEAFVVRDASGNVRVRIDERGIEIRDADGRARIRASVTDDGTAPVTYGEARVEVCDDVTSRTRSGIVLSDGVRGTSRDDGSTYRRSPSPRAAVFQDTGTAAGGPPSGRFVGAHVQAHRIGVVDDQVLERAALTVTSPSLVVRSRDGRLRFQR